MAYTVDYLYKKVLDGTDKIGSDFFTIPYVMSKLEAATYGFIGETIKYVENTQEIRDDLSTLYKPFKLPVVQDSENPDFKVVATPKDYVHLLTAKVVDADVQVRETTLIRNGQDEIYTIDPDTKPSAEYPLLSVYANYFKILSPGNPTHLQGAYIKKPTFGKFGPQDDIETEIAVDLPDNSTEKVIKILIKDIFVSTADPRAELGFKNEETYRHRRN
jgi:hypothetical protein